MCAPLTATDRQTTAQTSVPSERCPRLLWPLSSASKRRLASLHVLPLYVCLRAWLALRVSLCDADEGLVSELVGSSTALRDAFDTNQPSWAAHAKLRVRGDPLARESDRATPRLTQCTQCTRSARSPHRIRAVFSLWCVPHCVWYTPE